MVLALAASCAAARHDFVCEPAASWAVFARHCTVPPPPPVDRLAIELANEPANEPDPEPAPMAPAPAPDPAPEIIELREQVQFERDSAILLDGSRLVLDEVAAILGEHPEIVRIEIRGHTDGDGARDRNQRLSEERAAAVRAHLIGAGVAEERLTSRGVGEDEPVADNRTSEGKAQNRRVEVRILERR